MAKYGYKAFDAAGKIKKGSIEADTVETARGILKQQGMNPISIGEQSLLNSELNIEIGGPPVRIHDPCGRIDSGSIETVVGADGE